LKKFQCVLKIIVKHDIFDTAMLTSVILNTVIMAMEAYGNSPEKIAFLQISN